MRILEEGNLRRISGTGKAKAKFEKYHGVSEIKQYPDAADSTLPSSSKRKRSESASVSEFPPSGTLTHKKKKPKKEPKVEEQVEMPDEQTAESAEVDATKKKKKKKKNKTETEDGTSEVVTVKIEEQGQKKKKKKVKTEDVQ